MVKFEKGAVVYAKATGVPFKLLERKTYVSNKGIFGLEERDYSWIVQNMVTGKIRELDEPLAEKILLKNPPSQHINKAEVTTAKSIPERMRNLRKIMEDGEEEYKELQKAERNLFSDRLHGRVSTEEYRKKNSEIIRRKEALRNKIFSANEKFVELRHKDAIKGGMETKK